MTNDELAPSRFQATAILILERTAAVWFLTNGVSVSVSPLVTDQAEPA